ncbi:MAG: SPOR domain-containing protein [Pseudomonadota bacterium]
MTIVLGLGLFKHKFKLQICLACVLLTQTSLSPASNYSDGLSAYIKGNYELAQVLWLKAAKENNARAMFNLGLLHDQRKITNADPEKAERWFKIAGKNGYAAADYYYANRLTDRGAPKSEIIVYLRRAVTNGSYPAGAMLAELDAGESVSQIARERRENLSADTSLAVAEADNQNRSDEPARIERYLTESWIASKAADNWTIQLLAFEDQAKVRKFIDDHQLQRSAAYFVERTNQGVLYKLVYGAYETKEQADQARNALSPALREHGPWLRPMSSIQSIIAKQ